MIKARKLLLSQEEKLQAASRAFESLERSVEFMISNNILIYNSLADELSTTMFLEKWHKSKNFFLPRVNGNRLEILPYKKEELRRGSFNISEPSGEDVCQIGTIEMVIVPAVAYDTRGNRIGRGRGYYDRLLNDTKALKVGMGYDFQILDRLEAEPHDVPVDMIITNRRIINCKKRWD